MAALAPARLDQVFGVVNASARGLHLVRRAAGRSHTGRVPQRSRPEATRAHPPEPEAPSPSEDRSVPRIYPEHIALVAKGVLEDARSSKTRVSSVSRVYDGRPLQGTHLGPAKWALLAGKMTKVASTLAAD